MNKKLLIAAATISIAGLSLFGCTKSEPIGGDVIAPLTVELSELAGSQVELVPNQVLNIDTGEVAVDSFSADVTDGSVAEFTPGSTEGTSTSNPGFKALQAGSTDVSLTSTDTAQAEQVDFTISVTEAK